MPEFALAGHNLGMEAAETRSADCSWRGVKLHKAATRARGSALLSVEPFNNPRCASRLLCVVAIALTVSCTKAPDVPALTTAVNDFAHVLSGNEREALENDIIQFQNSSGAILVMVTANSFQPFSSISAFANELFKNHGRGIGDARRNNGLLVVLAVKDRQVRITTGLGMEQIVTDQVAADISQRMAPDFRRGAHGQGLRSGVAALRRVFDEHYGR